MAGSILDALASLTGRPDPQMQLMAAMGQAPGQPGGGPPIAGAPPPQGQAGGGPPNPAPGGPQAAQGPPGGQGGPPGQGGPNFSAPMTGQGQPAAQNYASPSDLSQLYLQMVQRQQASNQFNMGLGLLAASAYPGRHPEMIMDAMRGMNQGDPGATFQNLMTLQNYNQQQMRFQNLVQNSDQYAKSFGVDPTMFRATITAAGPQGAGDVLGKIAEAQMGITGSQTDKEYKQQVRNFQAANPGAPLPPELQSEAGFVQHQGAAVTTADAAAKEKLAAKSEFDGMDKQYQAVEQNIDWLNDPKNRDAVVQAIQKPELLTEGQSGRWLSAVPGVGVSQDVLNAKSKLDQLHNQLYSTSFSGKNQRLAAVEAQRLGNAYTNLTSPTLSAGAIGDELNRLQQQAYSSHANIYASAGQQIPVKYHGLADAQYLNPKEPLYNGATEESAPDFSQMSDADADAAVAKLSPGESFIGPDGKPHRKN